MMDYRCAKFDDFSFSRFGFIVWTDRITHRQTRITEADQRYTHVTTIGMSKNHECKKTSCHKLCNLPPKPNKKLSITSPDLFITYYLNDV